MIKVSHYYAFSNGRARKEYRISKSKHRRRRSRDNKEAIEALLMHM